jgi:phi13 family phage major tail protein
MSKIGLKYPVYAVATETTSSISYSGGAVLAKAINANISINTNDVKLYADDAIAESDFSFSSGTVTIEIDELGNAAQLALLGYAEGSTTDASLGTKELKASGTDTPAYVGFGFYGKKKVSNATRWRAVWLKKVQFKEPNDEMKTKGESVEFGTTTLEGTIMVAADGYWKEEGTFDTEAEAVSYLNTKTGISTDPSNNITELTMTNGTLSPTFAQATYIYSCACTGNTDITATFAAGTAKVYIDGTYVETLATTVKGASITMGVNTNKIIEITVQESGKSAITYTIVAQRGGS